MLFVVVSGNNTVSGAMSFDEAKAIARIAVRGRVRRATPQEIQKTREFLSAQAQEGKLATLNHIVGDYKPSAVKTYRPHHDPVWLGKML